MAHPIKQKISEQFGRRKVYTAQDAAALAGFSASTIKRWRRNGGPQATEALDLGGLVIPLYTPDDIKALKAYGAAQKPGPKPAQAA